MVVAASTLSFPDLKQYIRTCEGCSLTGKFGQCVPGHMASGSAEVMVVGEAPGYDEIVNSGRPFTGAAGKWLNELLQLAGLAGEQVYFTNIVKHRPSISNDTPGPEEIDVCTSLWLMEEIRYVQPKVIVPVGATAIRWFLPDVTSVSQAHRIPRKVNLDGYGEVDIFPTYHPAASLHRPALRKTLQEDYKALGSFLKGDLEALEPSAPRTEGYFETTDTEWLAGYLKEAGTFAIDTESDQWGFWGLSVSTKEGEGIVVRKDADLTPLIKMVEEGGVVVVIHNAMYDLGVLNAIGFCFDNCTLFDTMVASYLLGVEEQGLKPLAYRRLGVSMTRYDDLVGHYGQGRALEYLERASQFEYERLPEFFTIEPDKKNHNIPAWKSHRPQAIEKSIAGLTKAVTEKGADPFDRWKNWDKPLREAIEGKVGETFPQPGISDVPNLDTAVDYAACDADLTLQLKNVFEPEMIAWGVDWLFWNVDMPVVPILVEMSKVGIKVDLEYFRGLQIEFQRRIEEIEQRVWDAIGGPINLGSPPQKVWLLEKVLGLALSPGKGKTAAPSTNSDSLKPHKGHPVVDDILEYQRLVKMKGTYVDSYLELADENGRIHTTFKNTRVKSGRFSSADPNAQNVSKRGEGKRIRKGFIADDDEYGVPMTLLAIDYSQIEMRMMAVDSGCVSMLEAFKRNEDIHGATMRDLWNITEENTPPNVYEDKRTAIKAVGFGIIYGISGYGLADNDEMDITPEEGDDLIREWLDARPEVRAKMQERREFVLEHGYIREFFGRIIWVPEVYASRAKDIEHGVRTAINTPTQGVAANLIKIAMALVDEALKDGGYRTRVLLQVHDELIFEVPEDELFEVTKLLMDVMSHAWDFGIPTPVEAEIGPSWGDMNKFLVAT